MNSETNIRIGIVGCGLIGSSIAMACDAYFSRVTFLLYDFNQRNSVFLSQSFRDAQVVHEDGFADCDFIFVCTPVSTIAYHIGRLARYVDPVRTTLIDAGSVKQSVIDALAPQPPSNFVPGHPMAGGVASGPSGGTAQVIAGKRFVLTPVATTDPLHVERAADLLKSIGALVIIVDPTTHDRLLAITSHVPHVISFALVDLLMEAEAADTSYPDDMVVRSFRTISKFAMSDPKMWNDIILSNRTEVRKNIEALISILQGYDKLIADSDAEAIAGRLHTVAERRKRLTGEDHD